ncbi:hypothetical protein PR048_029209 [Dryococelus australis]|uniref:Uncharacterized protein n=1 Tax=Dryococelus australis TaxID=614101 RepID=A0ABQ9GFK3_9NEOP|nr:hypothetical protein PR048_029209 [Dryococelus australis]
MTTAGPSDERLSILYGAAPPQPARAQLPSVSIVSLQDSFIKLPGASTTAGPRSFYHGRHILHLPPSLLVSVLSRARSCSIRFGYARNGRFGKNTKARFHMAARTIQRLDLADLGLCSSPRALTHSRLHSSGSKPSRPFTPLTPRPPSPRNLPLSSVPLADVPGFNTRLSITHGGISLWSGSGDTKGKPKMKDKDRASSGKKDRRPAPRNFSRCHVAPRVLIPRIFLRNLYTCWLLQQGKEEGLLRQLRPRCQSFPGCPEGREGGDEAASGSACGEEKVENEDSTTRQCTHISSRGLPADCRAADALRGCSSEFDPDKRGVDTKYPGATCLCLRLAVHYGLLHTHCQRFSSSAPSPTPTKPLVQGQSRNCASLSRDMLATLTATRSSEFDYFCNERDVSIVTSAVEWPIYLEEIKQMLNVEYSTAADETTHSDHIFIRQWNLSCRRKTTRILHVYTYSKQPVQLRHTVVWETDRSIEGIALTIASPGTRRPDLLVGTPAGCSGDLSPTVPLAGFLAPFTLLAPPHVLVFEMSSYWSPLCTEGGRINRVPMCGTKDNAEMKEEWLALDAPFTGSFLFQTATKADMWSLPTHPPSPHPASHLIPTPTLQLNRRRVLVLLPTSPPSLAQPQISVHTLTAPTTDIRVIPLLPQNNLWHSCTKVNTYILLLTHLRAYRLLDVQGRRPICVELTSTNSSSYTRCEPAAPRLQVGHPTPELRGQVAHLHLQMACMNLRRQLKVLNFPYSLQFFPSPHLRRRSSLAPPRPYLATPALESRPSPAILSLVGWYASPFVGRPHSDVSVFICATRGDSQATSAVLANRRRRWNERAGATEDPRENLPTSGIVRYDSVYSICRYVAHKMESLYARGLGTGWRRDAIPQLYCTVKTNPPPDAALKDRLRNSVRAPIIKFLPEYFKPITAVVEGLFQLGTQAMSADGFGEDSTHPSDTVGKIGESREYPPTSGIVRHDSDMRKPLGRPRRESNPWSNHYNTAPPFLYIEFFWGYFRCTKVSTMYEIFHITKLLNDLQVAYLTCVYGGTRTHSKLVSQGGGGDKENKNGIDWQRVARALSDVEFRDTHTLAPAVDRPPVACLRDVGLTAPRGCCWEEAAEGLAQRGG